MARTEIVSYGLQQYSGAALSALIYLYGANNKHIGNAYFARYGDPIPAPSQRPDGFVSLYFHHSAFAFVVDILRNEKPCYLSWFTSSGAIGTGAESVGEHELTS
jgi:hypothetical protein